VTAASDRRRFYVTGASGFLGRRVCGRLVTQGDVSALFRDPADGPWGRADLVDLSSQPPPDGALDGVDTVIHAAARTHAIDEPGGRDTESLYQAINVGGTRRLLEAAGRAGVRRFVFVSSVKAMGEGGPEAQDETSPSTPATWYGKTKKEAETLVLNGGFVSEPVVLRPALMYGPGARGNVERMVDAIRAGRFPPVPEVANRRSVLHVDDAAGAVMLAANEQGAANRLFIVTDGRPCSTRQMYEWICGALGKEVPRWTVPIAAFRALARMGDAVGRIRGRRWAFDSDAYNKLFGSAVYDSSAIQRVLGFTPRWTFRNALPHLVQSPSNPTEGA
jgi:UDP-glucose 4-epimerase